MDLGFASPDMPVVSDNHFGKSPDTRLKRRQDRPDVIGKGGDGGRLVGVRAGDHYAQMRQLGKRRVQNV